MRPVLVSPRSSSRALEDVAAPPAPVARQRVRRRLGRRVRRLTRLAATALVAGGAVVAGALGIHFGLTAPYFAVASVEVQGASRVPPDAIVAAAGIVPGTNLFRLEPLEIERRLEALPEIRSVDVIRSLPNRLTIVVEERRPFTLVHTGRLHWIDEAGMPLGVAHEAVAPPAPVISGLSPEEISAMRGQPSARARTAIALIRLLLRSGSPLVAEVSEIDMSWPDGPVLYTVDGIEVRLGREGWEGRLARLEAVLAQIARSGEPVTSIDLRFRDQVVLNGGTSR